jgi:signal transduction histidine kinase/CheY-like chemotaxis protein
MNSFSGLKRIYFFVSVTIVVIFSANIYYYFKIYHQQLSVEKSFLLKQARITGNEIEKTGYQFENEISQILFTDSISFFFNDEQVKTRTLIDLKAFFFRYSNLINSIQYYDNQNHVLSLIRDRKNRFIMDIFSSHVQQELLSKETVVSKNKEYLYYIPVLYRGETVGNMVLSVDYLRYIKSVFTKLYLEDVQWQWVIDENGKIYPLNLPGKDQVKITRIEKIKKDISEDSQGTIKHNTILDNQETEIISGYFPIQILKQKYGIVFSIRTEMILETIVWNSVAVSIITLLLILIISWIFIRYIKSDQKEKQTLSESENLLSKIINDLSVGFVLIDQNKIIKKVNKLALEMFPPELKVKEREKMGDWFFKSGYSGEHKKLGEYFLNDVIFIKKENRGIALLKKESSIEWKGEKVFIVTLIDITSFEKTRKQNAIAVETKSNLLTRMSQEIHTPVQGIMGMLDAINLKELSPKHKEVFHNIQKTSELLLSIIDDILTFSRLEAGDLVIEEIPFSLRKEIDLALRNLTPQAKEKGLDFKVFMDKDIPENLLGDPFKLRQVIHHLVENAIKFTSKGRINLKVNQLENNEGKVSLQIIIEDTGIGIPQEDLKHIFEKEINHNETITRKFAGAGLGTALSKQMVELLKGEIKAESPTGLSGDPEHPGSRFILSLDFYSNERIQKDFAQDKVTSYSHINALIIKDNDIRSQRVQEIISNFGIHAKVNFYHEKTINLISSNLASGKERIHILILRDSANFNAFDFAGELANNGLIQKFLVIITSSNDIKGNYVKARKLGVDYYLIEPCQGSELFNIIQDNFLKIKIQPHIDNSLAKLRKDIKILMAEDNAMNQKAAQVVFKNLGYEIEIAENGLEVLEMVKAKKYDIIFMDIMMPEMDGWEATRELRNQGIKIPVVPLTADFSDEARVIAKEEQMEDFLAKPIKIDEVKRVMMNWFTEYREESPK